MEPLVYMNIDDLIIVVVWLNLLHISIGITIAAIVIIRDRTSELTYHWALEFLTALVQAQMNVKLGRMKCNRTWLAFSSILDVGVSFIRSDIYLAMLESM